MVLETKYAGRNIGDVFYTLRTDMVLNGAVSCDGSEYKASDFDSTTDLTNPYSLCINNKIPNVDYATYDTQLKNQGCCAYFGIDPANGSFRVPTLKDVFIEAGDSDRIAKYLAPGLPNITGSMVASQDATDSGNENHWTGAFTWRQERVANGPGDHDNAHYRINFDASRCSSIYKNNFNTVQPKAILLRPMVQLVIADGYKSDDPKPNEPGSGGSTESKFQVPYIFVPGTEAKALEVNANFDYVLKALQDSKDAAPVVHLAGVETITGKKTFTETVNMTSIEFYPDMNQTHGGYIDFHYAGSAADYTARIIEKNKGYLSINQNPPLTDNSTKIATTGWCRQLAIPKFYTSGTSWYVYYPYNRFIIQGGQISVNGNTATNLLQFLIKMKTTNYGINLSSEDISNTTVNGTEIGWGRLAQDHMYVARNNGYGGTQRVRWQIFGIVADDVTI